MIKNATNFSFIKSLLFLVFFTLISFGVKSQYWIQKGGGATIDEATDLALDSLDNAWTVGYFTGLASFGSTNLNSSGTTDIFVSKTLNNGNIDWAIKAGGASSDRAEAVAVDRVGNVYVTGYFNGNATFGNVILQSAGLQDVFVAKYNTNGVLVWAVKGGGVGADVGFGIDVNNDGDVFITGSFKDSVNFGAHSLLSHNSTSDIFIAKLDAAGNFKWAKSGTSKLSNLGRSVGTDNFGNVYVAGQFSDTITFDQTYYNQGQNLVFVVKVDSLGNEVWFTKIHSTLSILTNDLAVDSVGNCFLTGDFEGVLNLYDVGVLTPVSLSNNSFSDNIFLIKYDSSGAWQIKEALGSNNILSSQSIAVDESGNAYVGGHFECSFSSLSSYYGESNFLSVGDADVFVTKFNSNGNRSFSKHIGGIAEDNCFGIGVSSSGEIHAAGSFEQGMHVPVSSNFNSTNLQFWTNSTCASNSGYCADPFYGDYRTLNSQGNKDAFIINGFDSARSPLDYFDRTGLNCAKQIPEICISNCLDTISGCEKVVLSVNNIFCSSIAPDYSISWSNGSNKETAIISNSGWQSVTIFHPNGCFSKSDSVYVRIYGKPLKPHITDGKGFNFQNVVTADVQLCSPDTTLLVGGGFGSLDSIWWESSVLTNRVFDSNLIVSSTGIYSFVVKNELGCLDSTSVFVKQNLPLPPFNLQMNIEDSVQVCFPDPVSVQLYDSVTNPNAAPGCLGNNRYAVFSNWQISPNKTHATFCNTYGSFDIDSSGWYTINDTTVRFNYCYSDTHAVSKLVHVQVNPKPIVLPFPISVTGDPILCPGGTNQLFASGGFGYHWFGPGVSSQTDSVLNVSLPGKYTVKSTKVDTNQFGCLAQVTMSKSFQVSLKPQPQISASPLVICPNSTVTLFSSIVQGNNWSGPNGPVGFGQSVSVSDPGQYFTVVNDQDSCGLVSNTVTVQQYATPSLVAYGDTTICPGAITLIGVQASPGAMVTWDPPLSGSSNTQLISTPGVYSCSIVSCGITTNASITIHLGNPAAKINPVGVLCKDSTMLLQGPPGMISYSWLPTNDSTQNIVIDSAGTYTLSITDAFGCSGSSAPFVVNEISPSVQLYNSTLGFCFGDTITLKADTNLASYLWLPGGQTSDSIMVAQPGSYSLSVVDTNGCPTIGDPFIVTQSSAVADVSLWGDSAICKGDTSWLHSVIMGYSSYSWYPINSSASSIPVTDSGAYVLMATDSAGCVLESDTINFSILELPLGNVSANGVLCKDSTLSINGPIGMVNYRWLPGNQTTSNISVSDTGNYYLQVTDSNGCLSVMDTFNVQMVTIPVAINNQVFGFCEGDSLQLGVTPGVGTYQWMPNGDTTSGTWIYQSGSVSVLVTDTNGCNELLGPITVTQSSATTSLDLVTSDEVCEGDTAVLVAVNSGFSSYSWQPGNLNSTTLMVTESGTYWFNATDSVGCISTSDSLEINVVENNLLPPNVNVDSEVCQGSEVMFLANGGGHQVVWYFDKNGNPFHAGDTLTRQAYSNMLVFVQTVSEPCVSAWDSVMVQVENCDEEPDVSNVFTPNGDGVNDGWSMHILGAECYEVEIYNRWGMLIYTLHSNGEEWNGKVEKSNLDAPDGTYYYILSYCNYEKKSFTKTGYITLIR